MENGDCLLRLEASDDAPFNEQTVIRLLTKAGLTCEAAS